MDGWMDGPIDRLTFVVGEHLGEWLLFDFLQKQVLLVEEEDHGGLHKPLVVENGIEQPQRFIHPILRKRRREEGKEGERKGGREGGRKRGEERERRRRWLDLKQYVLTAVSLSFNSQLTTTPSSRNPKS